MSSLSLTSASEWGYQPRKISPDELFTAVSEAVEAALGDYSALPDEREPCRDAKGYFRTSVEIADRSSSSSPVGPRNLGLRHAHRPELTAPHTRQYVFIGVRGKPFKINDVPICPCEFPSGFTQNTRSLACFFAGSLHIRYFFGQFASSIFCSKRSTFTGSRST